MNFNPIAKLFANVDVDSVVTDCVINTMNTFISVPVKDVSTPLASPKDLIKGLICAEVVDMFTKEKGEPASVFDQFRRAFSLRRRQNKIACTYVEEYKVKFTLGNERFHVRSMSELFTLARATMYHSKGVILLYKNKPLNEMKNLRDYGFDEHNYNQLTIQYYQLVGGNSNPPYILYTHVNECEQRLLIETMFASRMQVQADDTQSSYAHNTSVFMKHVSAHLVQFFKNNPGYDQDFFTELSESIALTWHWGTKCTELVDYVRLAQMSYRLFTGKSTSVWLSHKISEFMKPSTVQGDTMEETLKNLRKCFDTMESVKDSPIVKRLHSIYSYLLVQGFLRKLGLTLNDNEYSKMEQRALLSSYSSRKGFFFCVLETTLFICERIQQWHSTGKWSVFTQNEIVYTEWMNKTQEILNLSPHLSNLEAHGTSYFSFLSDLNDAIEKGDAYCKFMKQNSGISAGTMATRLNALKMLKNTEITRRAAQQERQSPFGVLVHGGSSIAKSAFTKMLFSYYGALFDLDCDDHYRYVRNPMDEYWSNFDSSKWCIQLDDIAFLKPSKTTDVDSTLQDLLNVVNNVPYVPPQAAIEDKGKTPVMAKLVIATSNSHDLNAHEYFHCPLAVRRRLPYVITLKPKQEFLHSNGKFIDPSKIVIKEGCYPDLWEINVQKLVPVIDQGRERAKLESLNVFTDVNRFLSHFGRACQTHVHYQTKAMNADDGMKAIKVCKVCLKPQPHICELRPRQVQATDMATDDIDLNVTDTDEDEEEETSTPPAEPWYTRMFEYLIECSIQWNMMWTLIRWAATFRSLRFLFGRFANYTLNRAFQMKMFGIFVNRPRGEIAKRISIAIALLGVCMTAYKLYYALAPKKVDKKEDDEFEFQGNTYGTTEDQLKKETMQNVWYNPNIELRTCDLPIASGSLVGKTHHELRDLFGANCVLLHIRGKGCDSVRHVRGVFIRGHQCITNAHGFRDDCAEYTVTVIQSNNKFAINSNMTLEMKRTDVSFSEDSDVCMFEVFSLPPFKDITKFWANKPLVWSSGVELRREETGEVNINPIYGLVYNKQFPVMTSKYDVVIGDSQDETALGQCGSLLIATTPRGPTLAGLHFLGQNHRVGFLVVTLDEIETLCKNSAISKRPVVQGGGMPNLSCESRTTQLTDLHHKSVLRYIEEGHVNVYGSSVGFRRRPKSTVCPTPLCETFLSHYGVENNYDKPSMSGFEPWRNNVIDMIQPQVNYERDVLRHCVDAYTKDILEGLPKGWEREVVTLSDKAAVNGLPGVKYIDRMNMATSMGHPWSKSKDQFIFCEKDEKYPEGVNFEEEVWERVRHIEQLYSEGKRAYPVFTGHLKDEATPKEKCAIHKTRVFTGAPVDWSIVVRKHMLPLVRLIQKNKILFECGAGTVTQSKEWGQLYEHLTQFGTDRMVAGDYKKYDKKMLSDLVLAAFEILYRIMRAAGFSEEEARIIMCIGEDTAFPWTDFNGDFVEFFGTNPSGHPLTVIINSIVNSLYMRYCYTVLNPKRECLTFKQFVALFTYGDDNTMGVHRLCDWFNHTDIAKALAKIHVTYTMADKSAKSIPFIDIKDVSFLKRKWEWNDEVGAWMAPLEEASIIKSLTMWVPSKSIDKYKQMVAVMSSANSEYFFYGRKKHEQMRQLFMSLCVETPFKSYVTETTFPTYDMLVERFHSTSSVLSAEADN